MVCVAIWCRWRKQGIIRATLPFSPPRQTHLPEPWRAVDLLWPVSFTNRNGECCRSSPTAKATENIPTASLVHLIKSRTGRILRPRRAHIFIASSTCGGEKGALSPLKTKQTNKQTNMSVILSFLPQKTHWLVGKYRTVWHELDSGLCLQLFLIAYTL